MAEEKSTTIAVNTIFEMIRGTLGAANDLHHEGEKDKALLAVQWAEGQFSLLRFLRDSGTVFTHTEHEQFLDLAALFAEINGFEPEEQN